MSGVSRSIVSTPTLGMLLRMLLAVWIGSVLFAGAMARAQAVEPQLAGAELVAALKSGGLVILMRHMSTDSVAPEDGTHTDTDCSTQRNLDERGRQEATSVGEAVKSLGLPIGNVFTSPYCRCVDTGMLVFGKATKVDELAVFDVLTGAAKEERAKMIRGMLNTPPEPNTNDVLITHTGSLLYTFGLQTRPEGIAHMFRPAEYGAPVYVGRVTPEQWRELAGAVPGT
jgi:phosphohistidine phosphatase SixA